MGAKIEEATEEPKVLRRRLGMWTSTHTRPSGCEVVLTSPVYGGAPYFTPNEEET